MSALLGIAISSVVIGTVSDKIGRKPCIVFCMFGSVIGCIAKFLLRESFWSYCAANFCNGLVSATLPVAIAYVGDVYTDRKEKENEIGLIIGLVMLGSAGGEHTHCKVNIVFFADFSMLIFLLFIKGGILAILMETQGLFAPLLVGAAIMFVAAILGFKFIIEPRNNLIAPKVALNDEFEEEQEKPPEDLDAPTMLIIILGALLDNIGSSGLTREYFYDYRILIHLFLHILIVFFSSIMSFSPCVQRLLC